MMDHHGDVDSVGEKSDDEEDWQQPQDGDMSMTFGLTPKRQVAAATSTPLRGEHDRTIIHIDIDCFYAQVEMIRNPELRNKPLGNYMSD